MVRLLEDTLSQGFETVRKLISHDGFTVELGEAIRKDGGAERAVRALQREFFPVEPIAVQPSVVSEPAAPPKPKRWRDMGDYLILPLVIDRVSSGEEWIPRTDKKGNHTNDWSRRVLRSNKFTTTPVGTYEVAVLKGASFSSDPYTKDIRKKAKQMKWTDLNPDIACFIREQYTDEELAEMGLWWITVMHEPIVSDGFSHLLYVDRIGDGRLLGTYRGDPHRGWSRNGGFAFLVPQVSLST